MNVIGILASAGVGMLGSHSELCALFASPRRAGQAPNIGMGILFLNLMHKNSWGSWKGSRAALTQRCTAVRLDVRASLADFKPEVLKARGSGGLNLLRGILTEMSAKRVRLYQISHHPSIIYQEWVKRAGRLP